MNQILAVNIINQFDNDLSLLINECTTSADFDSKKEQQAQLEKLIKQRGEALNYIKRELNG